MGQIYFAATIFKTCIFFTCAQSFLSISREKIEYVVDVEFLQAIQWHIGRIHGVCLNVDLHVDFRYEID